MGLQLAVGSGAVAAATRLPKARPVAYVTPSGASALGECLLKVAYGSDPDFRKEVPSAPAARLGTACHHVLETAGAGGIAPPDGPDWPEFEAAWIAAIREQEQHAAAHPFEKHWPAAERWPGYAMRKLRTKRLAQKLAAAFSPSSAPVEAAGTPPEVFQEHWQEALEGRLRGRADVIRRAPEHVIEDYKTGAIYEHGSEELKASYRAQLLLYAVLEEAESSAWPESAVLVPLEGEPTAIKIVPGEAEQVAAEAVADLDRYNAAMGGDPAELAVPSPIHCRYCPYSVRCPAFWEAVAEDWADEGIVAACGTVTAAERSRYGTVDLDLESEAGSVPPGALHIHALDPLQLPAEPEVAPGDALGVTGLWPAGDSAAKATARTRVAVESAEGAP